MKDTEKADITKLTYDDIKRWVLANSEDMELMDMLNRLTYPLTSKYSSKVVGRDPQ